MVAAMSWRIEQEWRKGPWTPAEDNLLIEYVRLHGEGRWSSVASCSGLKRNGKSCRLRWVNYLRPGLKKGQLTPQEEGIIIELHALYGNKWSTIARYLPGRTDNEIKNYWRTNFKKKGTPSQNQEKKRHKAAFRRDRYQQEVNEMMNNVMLPHYPEENNQDMITGLSQGKMEIVDTSPASDHHQQQQQHNNQSLMARDVASWWDTVSDDCLWSGDLWNLGYDQPNRPIVMEQSFSSYI